MYGHGALRTRLPLRSPQQSKASPSLFTLFSLLFSSSPIPTFPLRPLIFSPLPSSSPDSQTPNISWDRSLHFMRDMAEGVSILHDFQPAPIIHRDLKSLNLLVTKDYRVKLCDFGLSRSKQGDMQTFNRLCGTFAYCAPEVFNGDKVRSHHPLFSFISPADLFSGH